jgi:hypothetical protein
MDSPISFYSLAAIVLSTTTSYIKMSCFQFNLRRIKLLSAQYNIQLVLLDYLKLIQFRHQ